MTLFLRLYKMAMAILMSLLNSCVGLQDLLSCVAGSSDSQNDSKDSLAVVGYVKAPAAFADPHCLSGASACCDLNAPLCWSVEYYAPWWASQEGLKRAIHVDNEELRSVPPL